MGLSHGWPPGQTPHCSAISRSNQWASGQSGVSAGYVSSRRVYKLKAPVAVAQALRACAGFYLHEHTRSTGDLAPPKPIRWSCGTRQSSGNDLRSAGSAFARTKRVPIVLMALPSNIAAAACSTEASGLGSQNPMINSPAGAHHGFSKPERGPRAPDVAAPGQIKARPRMPMNGGRAKKQNQARA